MIGDFTRQECTVSEEMIVSKEETDVFSYVRTAVRYKNSSGEEVGVIFKDFESREQRMLAQTHFLPTNICEFSGVKGFCTWMGSESGGTAVGFGWQELASEREIRFSIDERNRNRDREDQVLALFLETFHGYGT